LASIELNGGSLFRDSVTFSIVTSVDGTGAADFNGYGGLPYDWTVKVTRCGDSAERAAAAARAAWLGTSLTPIE
jgi:hypothetical protein